MSRAFTKEDDAGDDLPEIPVPPGPNYVTPRGMELLRQAGLELAERKKRAKEGDDRRPIERDLRYLEARVDHAVVVPPGSGAEARFGAKVTLEDAAGGKRTFQIVGEDEARTDIEAFLPWSAPLASAILGAKAGDVIEWQGPEQTIRYKILAVEYPK